MTNPAILDISSANLRLVTEILQKYVPGREVWAFGSRVTGKARKYSDLDLAIIGNEPLPAAVKIDLAEEFAESDLPFPVDVVDWASTSENFRLLIARHKFVIQLSPQ